MIPKDQKVCNLHYDDVRGDGLLPPHATTPAAVTVNKFWMKILWMWGTQKEAKIAKSVLLSLFMRSNGMVQHCPRLPSTGFSGTLVAFGDRKLHDYTRAFLVIQYRFSLL